MIHSRKKILVLITNSCKISKLITPYYDDILQLKLENEVKVVSVEDELVKEKSVNKFADFFIYSKLGNGVYQYTNRNDLEKDINHMSQQLDFFISSFKPDLIICFSFETFISIRYRSFVILVLNNLLYCNASYLKNFSIAEYLLELEKEALEKADFLLFESESLRLNYLKSILAPNLNGLVKSNNLFDEVFNLEPKSQPKNVKHIGFLGSCIDLLSGVHTFINAALLFRKNFSQDFPLHLSIGFTDKIPTKKIDGFEFLLIQNSDDIYEYISNQDVIVFCYKLDERRIEEKLIFNLDMKSLETISLNRDCFYTEEQCVIEVYNKLISFSKNEIRIETTSKDKILNKQECAIPLQKLVRAILSNRIHHYMTYVNRYFTGSFLYRLCMPKKEIQAGTVVCHILMSLPKLSLVIDSVGMKGITSTVINNFIWIECAAFIDYPPNQFDTVFAVRTLEYENDIEIAIKEMTRVANKKVLISYQIGVSDVDQVNSFDSPQEILSSIDRHLPNGWISKFSIDYGESVIEIIKE